MKKFLTTAFGIICVIGLTGYLVNLKNQKDNEFKEQVEKEDQRVKRLRVNVGNVQSTESEENGELDGDEPTVDEGGGGNWSAKTDEDYEARFKREDAPRYSDEKDAENDNVGALILDALIKDAVSPKEKRCVWDNQPIPSNGGWSHNNEYCIKRPQYGSDYCSKSCCARDL